MIDLAITLITLGVVFVLHVLLHWMWYLKGKKTFFVVVVYLVGSVFLAGIFWILPNRTLGNTAISSSQFPITCMVIYVLVSILIIDFYATPYLGYESPVSAILRITAQKPYSKQKLLNKLRQVLELDSRFDALQRTRFITYRDQRYFPTTKACILSKLISLYLKLIGWSLSP